MGESLNATCEEGVLSLWRHISLKRWKRCWPNGKKGIALPGREEKWEAGG